MRATKVVALAIGSILAVISVGLLVAGAALVLVHATQRDDDGYYTTTSQTFETDTYALTTEEIDLGVGERGDLWSPIESLGTARLEVDAGSGDDVFVGVADARDAATYLAGTAHAVLVDTEHDPFRPVYDVVQGTEVPEPPSDVDIWEASTTGPGEQTLTWDVETGSWAVVVMNADGTDGVAIDVVAGFRTGWLLPIGLGLLAGGLLVAAIALALLIGASRRGPVPATPAEGAPVPTPAVAGAYPARLEGHLDDDLNRWMWLVKWFLAIPHLIVLAFLWVAAMFLTIAAGVAILFTGRYPRGIFDIVVGVMRWTWRVTFYAFTLGTDRYPPFTLADDPTYPARFDVAYPEALSKPLVLVKWWLLALPHYLIVALFGGGFVGWTWGASDGDGRAILGGGLIGILVIIAGVVLLFTRRYPETIFEFVMGMQRWIYRVFAYASLMTDEYPPFRLDNGGSEPEPPISPPPPPPPSVPEAPSTDVREEEPAGVL